MRARNVIVLILAVLLMLTPLTVYAELTPAVKTLDTISDEALDMVKSYRYDDAKRLLDHFEEMFLTITGKGHLFTMDELRIITIAHNDANEAVVSTTMEHGERMNRVTKFRLVIDALMSNHQPLWTGMETPIMTVFGEMKTAVQNGDNEDFYANLNSFLSLYNVIYPSLKIDVTPERIQKLNARVNFIDHFRPEILSKTNNHEELDALETDLRNIFNDMTEDETDPSLWWIIISTGSIIILTLSYVGWRKFQADREKRRNHQKERKN